MIPRGFEPIRSGIMPVGTWSPERANGTSFHYIDIGSVDREAKTISAADPVLVVNAPSRARQLLQTNDVLVSTVRPSLNAVAIVPTGLDGAVASTGFTVLRANPAILDTRFLFYWVRTPAFIAQMTKRATGASYPAVSDRIVLDSEMPMPVLEEQRRIAGILDGADAVRRKREETVMCAGELLRSAFADMLGSLDRSNCPTRSLGECCELITDGAHITPTYVAEGVPFLRVTDIQEPLISWATVKRIPRSEHSEMTRRHRAERGDVLYSKNGTIGIPRLVDWDEEFSFFVSLCLLKPRRDILRGEFLASFLQSDRALRQATAHSKTLTVTNLHLVEIRKMRLPLPTIQVQDEWIRHRAAIERTKEIVARAAEEGDALYASLVQKAFRGEL